MEQFHLVSFSVIAGLIALWFYAKIEGGLFWALTSERMKGFFLLFVMFLVINLNSFGRFVTFPEFLCQMVLVFCVFVIHASQYPEYPKHQKDIDEG